MPSNIQITTSLVGPTISITTDTAAHNWFSEQARNYDLRWLLAHADNGVIWGELRDGTLHLSCTALGPEGLTLDWKTLQQARLFGPAGELRVWQGPQGWQARLRRDDAGVSVECLDEKHMLWGTRIGQSNDGFSEMIEGAQGIIHTPPITVAPTDKRRAALLVRHYISEDDTGIARIVDSRLVGLQAPKEEVK
ncbi:MAG: CRISPR-associated protein Csx19 [Chloroflexales bacterium]|jgi:CRISPR-associated protein (TIGR03984 family)